MKKCLLFFKFVAAVSLLFGVEQLDHEKRIHLGDDGRIYVWNTELNLFLGVGDEPREAVKLKSLHEVQTGGTEGFKLDFDGEHVIFHPENRTKSFKDSSQNKKAIFPVVADWKTPNVSRRFLPQVSVEQAGKRTYPQVVREGRTVFPGALGVSFLASDSGSGLRSRFYSINGTPYQAYASDLVLEEEGVYDLLFYAVDNVGNYNLPLPVKVGIDTTPPVSALRVTGPFLMNRFVGPSTRISLSATDGLAGVGRIFYRPNSERTFEYEKPFEFGQLPEGEYSFVYFSSDRVHNREADQSRSFFYDKTPPVMSLSFDGDFYPQAGKNFVSARTRISITALDENVEVSLLEYSLNSKGFQSYGLPFSLPGDRINHTLGYRSADALDNRSALWKARLVLDSLPPKIDYRFVGPHYFSRGVNFIRKGETRIEISAYDELSGVGYVETVKNENLSTTDATTVTFDTPGEQRLEITAVDRVNNSGESVVLNFYVDDVPPEISMQVSLKPLDAGETNRIYPQDIDIFFSAEDDDSGIDQIFYRINGGEKMKYEVPFEINETGEYVISTQSFDNVGNRTDRDFRFEVR